MDSKWTTSRKDVYRWVKDRQDPPLKILQRTDGSMTASVDEMDSMVREAWSSIMRKYADTAEPDAEGVRQAHHLRGDENYRAHRGSAV